MSGAVVLLGRYCSDVDYEKFTRLAKKDAEGVIQPCKLSVLFASLLSSPIFVSPSPVICLALPVLSHFHVFLSLSLPSACLPLLSHFPVYTSNSLSPSPCSLPVPCLPLLSLLFPCLRLSLLCLPLPLLSRFPVSLSHSLSPSPCSL